MGHKVSGFKNLSQKSQGEKNLLGPHFLLPSACLSACVCACTPAMVHSLVWKLSEDNFQKSILSSYFEGPGDQTRAIRLGSECSGEPQRQISGPENLFSNLPIPHLPPRHS